LDVFEIEIFLVIFLHLEEIVELEVQFEKSAVSSYFSLAIDPNFSTGGKHTFVMKRNNKSTRQRTREVEINVRPPVIRHIALLNNTLLLQLLMCKLVRPQNLVLLLFASRTFALTADVVEIALVGLELADEICVVVADCLEDFFEFLSLDDDSFFQ